jgi:UDP-N-acetylmuramoyl-L-alanyl-D-glutamate--2,6-diaminopimelate ligase
VAGFTKDNHIIENDRELGIIKAVELADKNSIIVVAGKGHEAYQILGKSKIHFDDREYLRREIIKKKIILNK